MSKSHRLFDLMQILRRHRQPVAGLDLAQESGVSLRTIRRDVATLQAMGADIEGEPGVGYVLKPGFLLPPLMFLEEELHALTLGAELVRQQTDDSLALAAKNAIAKIDAVLPAELRHHVYNSGFHVGERPPQPQSFDLAVLRRAMREQRKVLICYRDFNNVATKRIIWPISLGFFENRRFVAGWCELRQDFRTFRVDRIEDADVETEQYPGRRRDLVKQWRSQVADESNRNAAT
ncbi:Predicted DNA-binding transcriptional regulator YafY, contains an HTH and WYL domains [Rhizobium tibeticum]|uniref:HTH domain protein n=1 Tax=Rhizobium tibeticum TaxID=501024 RepID=A0A1H8VR48_9HYPH|nr:YafY family protein [Rhizobium tibeticum]SEI19474.1 HTH domain protein [Rhizobium tibeticum]SEP17835.1 Predicted DNA-binding transcriptional regulator YafY, contains an HTH and WYL domains [Rhizobium tibeticum]